jgi:DNA-binding NarL/FixJ family response regulator
MTYSRKIIIVDDHEMIVQGLKSYLSTRLNNFQILSANSISQLFGVIETNSIDVFLLDLMIGEDDSRLYIKKIKEANARAKILIISSYESTDIMNSVFDVGADGFIGKSNSSQYIVDGINSVLNDQKYLDPNSENKFEKEKASLVTESEQIQLTKREKEVLLGVLKEKSTKEIASALFLTTKTIEFHRSNLLTKFNVKNVSGLVRKAMLKGYDLEKED